jgi:hypothetical protein
MTQPGMPPPQGGQGGQDSSAPGIVPPPWVPPPTQSQEYVSDALNAALARVSASTSQDTIDLLFLLESWTASGYLVTLAPPQVAAYVPTAPPSGGDPPPPPPPPSTAPQGP